MNGNVNLEYSTECQLCHKVRKHKPTSIPLNGTLGTYETGLLRDFTAHVATKHRKQLETGVVLIQQYQTFLLLTQYKSTDPQIERVIESMRADIFRRCRKNVPSDEDLKMVAERCNFPDEETATKAWQAMRAIRDLCCELGAAAPNFEESKIIVPA